jgi:hypothetical protein
MCRTRAAGDKLARRIHELRADLHVLLCTGNDERVRDEAKLPPAIAGVLLKPFEPGALSREIRRILNKSAPGLPN